MLRCPQIVVPTYTRTHPMVSAAETDIFSSSFGRTDLKISASKAKNCEQFDFEVRFPVRPPKLAEKGKQCYCEEYDEIQDNWQINNPDDYKRWNEAEELSIDSGEDNPGSIFNSKKCPLCRSVYS